MREVEEKRRRRRTGSSKRKKCTCHSLERLSLSVGWLRTALQERALVLPRQLPSSGRQDQCPWQASAEGRSTASSRGPTISFLLPRFWFVLLYGQALGSLVMMMTYRTSGPQRSFPDLTPSAQADILCFSSLWVVSCAFILGLAISWKGFRKSTGDQIVGLPSFAQLGPNTMAVPHARKQNTHSFL
jgi:hypothetical protein